MAEKEALIRDIERLLNSYEGQAPTQINPDLLAFMDETTLRSIIASLLDRKEKVVEENLEWLEQFKKY